MHLSLATTPSDIRYLQRYAEITRAINKTAMSHNGVCACACARVCVCVCIRLCPHVRARAHVRVSTQGSVRASLVALVRSQCVCEARPIRTMCPCARVRTSVRVCVQVLVRTHVRVWVLFHLCAAIACAKRVQFAKPHQVLVPINWSRTCTSGAGPSSIS